MSIINLRSPHVWYPKARSISPRKVVAYLGPTNSGKTHSALQSLYTAPSGTYCGPLRLLAQEQYHRAARSPPFLKMGLKTGETVLTCTGDTPSLSPTGWWEGGAKHVSCTVEMADLQLKCAAGLLDEVQMVGDEERGWAFTQILLGLPCAELHVCGEPAIEDLLTRLCELSGSRLETRKTFERLVPLEIMDQPVQPGELTEGDAIIAFSRANIFDLKAMIERATGKKAAVIYGGLPLEHRTAQADSFNSRKVSLLVASDAIGLGLNLSIGRVLFTSLCKWSPSDGGLVEADSRLLRQIGGRAGRFGSEFGQGRVGILQLHPDPVSAGAAKTALSRLRKLWTQPIQPYERAGLLPPDKMLAEASSGCSLQLLSVLSTLSKRTTCDAEYFVCSVLSHQRNLQLIEHLLPQLSIFDAITLAHAPVRHLRPVSEAAFLHMVRHMVSFCAKSAFKSFDVERFYLGAGLAAAEEAYRALELCKWIALRFPHAFSLDNASLQQQFIKCSLFIREKLALA